jgi:hypothetical protein
MGCSLLHKESSKIGRATRESIIIIPADAGGTWSDPCNLQRGWSSKARNCNTLAPALSQGRRSYSIVSNPQVLALFLWALHYHHHLSYRSQLPTVLLYKGRLWLGAAKGVRCIALCLCFVLFFSRKRKQRESSCIASSNNAQERTSHRIASTAETTRPQQRRD